MERRQEADPDASFAPHDRSQFTYASSYTEYGLRSQPMNPNISYADPASQSYISVPGVRIVDVEPSHQMFPSKPRASMILSIISTFLCCFACSIPAIILSKQAMDHEREGEKRLAARLANQIAFWLLLSLIGGMVCWSCIAIFTYAYRFYW